MRVTDDLLEKRLKSLNNLYGFKGHKYVRVKSTGKVKTVGSGFELDSAYGGVSVVFIRNGGQRTVSGRMSKSELYDYLEGMIKAVKFFKERALLR